MQIAGHPDKIKFQNASVSKQVNQTELETYKSLEAIGITRFVPKLIDFTDESIVIENLLQGTNADTVRIMDIKLGTSTLTMKSESNVAKADYRLQKDLATTSAKLGFCITGYKTSSEIEVKVHKKVRLENVSLYLAKVLYGPGMDLIKTELTEFL